MVQYFNGVKFHNRSIFHNQLRLLSLIKCGY